MPGNKNSGRKKKVTDEIGIDITIKRPVGRPKKQKINVPKVQKSDEIVESGKPTIKRTKQHIVDLGKRSSLLYNFYNQFLGPPLEIIPSTRLPLRRVVLQRYRAIRSTQHNSPRNEIVGSITDEVVNLWENSSIPHITHHAAAKLVQDLISKWVDSTDEEKKSRKFQKYLDTLLDFRPRSESKLSLLKSFLKSSGNADWLRDYEFFKGQCKFPQTTQMSSTIDGVLKAKERKNLQKKQKYQLYAEKNRTDFSTSETITPRQTKARDMHGIDRQNILSTSRKLNSTPSQTKEIPQVNECSSEEDEEWELPVRVKRRLRKRPDKITLTFPAKTLPTVLAKTSIVTKTSASHELKIWTNLIHSGGGSLGDTSLSLSTIRRQRRSEVSASAMNIRERVKDYARSKTENDFVVLHFDGKIIHYITGEEDDRLAVCISVPNMIPGQFLASPGMPDGKGKTMSTNLNNVIEEFGLTPKVEALVFDTTASNTGVWRGATSLLEKTLGRAMFWLACRHHVAELFIKHANDSVRGESKAPEDSVFTKFRRNFGLINGDERELWLWPDENDWRHQRALEVLAWAENHMKMGTWPREDYRELLELTVIFLGGAAKRMQYGCFNIVSNPIRKPGACHRARFMAHCLYILKIFLYKSQFIELTPEQASQICILAEYIALIHVPYFLKTPISTSAPRQDRDMWIDLVAYKGCFDETSVQFQMVTAVQDNFCSHLWYLTEQLVVFSLFDKYLPNEERKAIASQLSRQRRPAQFHPGKPKFCSYLMRDDVCLESFVGEKSWLLFDKLDASGNWLNDEPETWENDSEYCRISLFLRDLKVVNDLAERCVKDVQEYKNFSHDSSHRDEILMVASDHRKIFRDLRKHKLMDNFSESR